jgi:hypothetical protein
MGLELPGMSQDGSSAEQVLELFLSGVLPEEGSPPPSSTPDIYIALNRPCTPMDELPQRELTAPDSPVRGLFMR